MPANDLIALEAHYKHWSETRGAGLTGFNKFDYYCLENILKAYPVNDKELKTGAVDKQQDGGIDGFFFFANRRYVFEDTVLDKDAEYRVNLIVFQGKEGSGFSPHSVAKFREFADDLLDLGRDEKDYAATYHSKLKGLMRAFKDQYTSIAGSVSSIEVDFFYATKLDLAQPAANSDVMEKAVRVKATVAQHFKKAKCSLHFIGAEGLLAQALVRKAQTKNLTYASQTIQAKEGWIGLVHLRSLYQFLRDEHGDFHEEMLEENVRGYQSDTSVNDGIGETLRDAEKSAEFWVLHNGITILAKQLTPGGSFALAVKDPQIVNGLQTSRVIFDYYKSINGGVDTDKRSVLVRIVETSDEGVRDQIIRATNSQNKMPPEALRATDLIHRKIEELFTSYGLYYDRRKGHYKDQGRPAAKIVSVRDVLQATLAVALKRPHDARGRPADYLKENPKYAEVFGDNVFDLTTYLKCTELVRHIEASPVAKAECYKGHELNLLFYVALYVACRHLSNAHAPAKLIYALKTSDIDPTTITEAYAEVFKVYEKAGGDDKAAKGADMAAALLKRLEEVIQGK